MATMPNKKGKTFKIQLGNGTIDITKSKAYQSMQKVIKAINTCAVDASSFSSSLDSLRYSLLAKDASDIKQKQDGTCNHCLAFYTDAGTTRIIERSCDVVVGNVLKTSTNRNARLKNNPHFPCVFCPDCGACIQEELPESIYSMFTRGRMQQEAKRRNHKQAKLHRKTCNHILGTYKEQNNDTRFLVIQEYNTQAKITAFLVKCRLLGTKTEMFDHCPLCGVALSTGRKNDNTKPPFRY